MSGPSEPNPRQTPVEDDAQHVDGAAVEPQTDCVLQSEDSAATPVGQFSSLIRALKSTPKVGKGPQLPERIGRYRIDAVLGQGGFGSVYLAHDDQLSRSVAIKVPHANLLTRPQDAELYASEARIVAGLDHPHIVPVYDVGSTDGFPIFIVSKFVEGTDLATAIKSRRLSYADSAELVATVGETLHYAHKQGLVHRDVKPGNILLSTDGKPFLVDFGIALREQDVGTGLRDAGSPAYMSPEQARGEGHRVDGRSDIFSLGVVLYELLVGRRPFHADTLQDMLEQITSYEPKPPRQVDDRIPKELERICLKALSKRATERYTTASDFADDLRAWQAAASPEESGSKAGISVAAPALIEPTPATPSAALNSDSRLIKIVPKGLRSFDEHDADFFLELLVGPRDRDGLPDSIRFWKTRIEETDPDKTFSVGLIYGPSGCGKSSLVKAGLLPRLSSEILQVFVEATPDETETRLLHGLRKRCPALDANLGLKDSLAVLRRGEATRVGKKVLIVLDQFEQWLHAKKEEDNTELVQALRQCDGKHVQCVVMVRDDFWLAVSRFMRDLEVRLLDGQNSALTDLFDPDHARKVLTAFGRAFGRLPLHEPSREQKEFINQATNDLVEDGKVVCVRLALFAEMMKGKPWTSWALKEVGGTKGVGVTFLEETFSASTAPPEHRYHQRAARAVLKALLPESGSDIKGNMRSYDELLEASGYAARGEDFDELIRILDGEIRLITPTDPEGAAQESDSAPSPTSSGTRYYQLTHDYLVPSLRAWLTRKQTESRRGRAELRLAERSSLWSTKPENRHLPSLWEYLRIRLLTNRKNWTDSQHKMMGKAARVHGIRCGLAGLAAAAIVVVGFYGVARVDERQNRNYADAIVQSLMTASMADIDDLVDDLDKGKLRKYRPWVTPLLENLLGDEKSDSKERFHANLALVGGDPSRVGYLSDRLLAAKADEVPVIVKVLAPYRGRLLAQLWQTVKSGSADQRLRAAATLAQYDPQNAAWKDFSADVVTALVSAPSLESKQWIDMLQPAAAQLAPPLEARYRDRSAPRSAEHPLAAAALSEYSKSDPQKLAKLILLADNEREFLPLLQALLLQRKSAAAELRAVLGQSPPDATPEVRDGFWRGQANAVACLVGLGEHEAVWPLLKHAPNPSLRSYIIDRMARLRAGFEPLVDRLTRETDPSALQAIILIVGEFDAAKLASQQRQTIVENLANVYRENSNPGIHSAVARALHLWREGDTIKRIDDELRGGTPVAGRNWFVDQQGQTFVVVDGPGEFVMGEKTEKTQPKAVKLAHRFAIAANEVTLAQFQQFRKDHQNDATYTPRPDGPANMLSWYDAVAYCNWSSQQAGIPKDQWCYEPNDEDKYAEGMKIPADSFERTGYRLPLEAEWEYVCRAGTTSAYSFGESVELLNRYAWCESNSQRRTWSVAVLRPNEWGLFDMHGNAWEWCHDLWNPKSDDPGVTVTKRQGGRVMRGGASNSPPVLVRSAYRFDYPPAFRNAYFGFRPARTYP